MYVIGIARVPSQLCDDRILPERAVNLKSSSLKEAQRRYGSFSLGNAVRKQCDQVWRRREIDRSDPRKKESSQNPLVT